VDLGAGTATGHGSDTLTGIENVEGAGGDDTITGDGGPNLLIGGSGSDTIDGGGGDDTLQGEGSFCTGACGTQDDTLIGGDGNDTLQGDNGDDHLDGGSGIDVLTVFGEKAVSVDLSAGTATGEGSDTLINIENVTTSYRDDTITGGSGPNVLIGEGGNDTLDGMDGDDTEVLRWPRCGRVSTSLPKPPRRVRDPLPHGGVPILLFMHPLQRQLEPSRKEVTPCTEASVDGGSGSGLSQARSWHSAC